MARGVPKRKCLVEGCGKPAPQRSLCEKHYTRWKNHGDVNVVLTRRRPQTKYLVKCLTCGKGRYRHPSDERFGYGKYCSNRCARLQGNPDGVKRRSICIECHQEYRWSFRPDRNNPVFCGRECYLVALKRMGLRRLRAIARKNRPRSNTCTYSPKAEGYCGCGEDHSSKKKS